jgi:hypothetical protein
MSNEQNIKLSPTGKVSSKLDEKEKAIKQLVQSPELTNSAVVLAYKGTIAGDRIDLSDILDSLQQSSEMLQSDAPLALTENILISQAQSLNAMFCDLAIKANNQKFIDNMDKFLRLALKAQSQCRATLETLAHIKNPPIVFAKQANIAHHQQINNQQVNHTAQSEQTSEPVQQAQSAIEQQEKQAIPTVRAKKVKVERC